MVDWNKVKANWNLVKGVLQEQWADLTDDELLKIDGEKSQLIGSLQQAYGFTELEAERQVREFLDQQRHLWDQAEVS